MQNFRSWILLASLMAGGAQARPLVGVWGGDQTILTLTATGGEVQSGCAEGKILAPLRLDRKGRFAAKGTFQVFKVGPQLENDQGPVMPAATYTGRLDGGRLSLTIQAADQAAPMTYNLKSGARPKLLRCL